MNRKLVYGLTFAVLIFGIILGVLLVYKKPPALPGTPGTPPENCPATALVYVYLNDQQKSAADTVTSNLKLALQQYGLNILNVPVCSIPATSLSQKLRVYPALLFKGNISALSLFVVGEIDGYKVLNPGVSAYMASQAGLRPVLTYTAELYIVKGTAPFPDIRENESNIKYIVGQLSLSNITSIQQVSVNSLGINLTRLPAIVLKSNYNLSSGYQYVVPLGKNYYTFREDVVGQVLQYLGVQTYEILAPPNPDLLRKGVKIGDSDNLLFILEDYHCPYCAMLINSTGNMLYNYAKTGKLQVVFVDLIIHSEVVPMHAIAKCAYNQTKDGYAYFNVSQELYHLYISGTATTMADANKTVAKYFGKNILDKCAPLLNSYQSDIQAFSRNLMQQGFTGTPTLIFWSNKTHKGLIVEGCLDIKLCITEQQFSQILSWLQG